MLSINSISYFIFSGFIVGISPAYGLLLVIFCTFKLILAINRRQKVNIKFLTKDLTELILLPVISS